MTLDKQSKDRKVQVKHSDCPLTPDHIEKRHVKLLFISIVVIGGLGRAGWFYEERMYRKFRGVDAQGNRIYTYAADKHFYPPISPMRYIRSEVNLYRYLQLLQQCGGDYAQAYALLKAEKPRL